jgi:hypothetical protein
MHHILHHSKSQEETFLTGGEPVGIALRSSFYTELQVIRLIRFLQRNGAIMGNALSPSFPKEEKSA